jgi:ABC-2 type transport system permease protein
MEISMPGTAAIPNSAHSLSKPTPAYVILVATVVKGLQIARRYLPNLIGGFVELAIRAAFFFLMANAVSLSSRETFGLELSGRNLYIFFLGSLLLFIFTRSTLWGPINAVSNDLYNGTLEYLYSLPGSRYAYYVGTVTTEVLISMVEFLPLFFFLILYSRIHPVGILMIALACGLILTALTAMGIMIALLALIWRQVGSIAQVLGILFEMLAGAYLPVSAFPQALQYLAYFLPYTWGYDLVRYYSFAGQWHTIFPVWLEWIILAFYALVYTLVSRYLLLRAERMAKRIGLNVI